MVGYRSFTNYVADKFYNEMFSAIKNYIRDNLDKLDLYLYKVKNISDVCLSDINVRSVSVNDRPNMEIVFDVIVEATMSARESDYHYDETEECCQWFMLSCKGDLDCNLKDFSILSVDIYNRKNFQSDPLSDVLVPYIYKDKLENHAYELLEANYREALEIPMSIEPQILAERMGLTIELRRITKDFSTFGEIFFADCDTEFYDEATDSMVVVHIKAKTIVVDKEAYHLRNLGSVNNTIVHECVHWYKHRKAFALERLCNEEVKQIKCQVIGGVKGSTKSATDWMEWQANSLAPLIQMPLIQFKMKAQELVKKYRKELGTFELVDVMQPVIDELATFFCVSRCAAKIRLVHVGYDEAIGVFTYIDGRYVKPYGFKKGIINKNQTYTIGVQDAIIQSMINSSLNEQIKQGCYIFVDSHLCLNDPKYITRDVLGNVCLTEYARLHVHECCIAFDLNVKSVNKYGEKYYTECVLYRDPDSGLVFEAHFSADKSKSVQGKAEAISEFNKDIMEQMKRLPSNYALALKELMKWSGTTVEKLAEDSLLSTKTIQRMRNEDDYQTSIGTVIALCIGMQLPPILSRKLLETAGFTIRYSSEEHMMYDFILNGYYMHSIYECNELLVNQGFKELTASE